MTIRRRHAPVGTGASGQGTRHSHGGPLDPSAQGPLYGGQLDREPLWQPDLTAGIVHGVRHIIPRTIDIASFASTIRPPTVVDSLPALPDDDYPEGSLAFLTTDGKLWRNVADAWTVEVDGEDIIANSITAGQIAAGAIGTTELAADAVIANVANVGGTVTIDSTGISIFDGAITLQDYSGESSLDAYGFGGAWLSFLADGFYNSSFDYGVTGTDLTPDSPGDPTSTATYKASLSTQLPGWRVVPAQGGVLTYGQLRLMSDANALGGYALRFDNQAGDANSRFRFIQQDVPVLPGDAISLIMRWRYGASGAGNGIGRYIYYEWMDADHSSIATVSSEAETYSGSAAFFNDAIAIPVATPDKARFLRLTIGFYANGAGSALIDSLRIHRRQLKYMDLIEVQGSSSGVRVNTNSVTFGAGAGVWTGPTFQRAHSTLLDLTTALRLGGGLYWDLPGSSGESSIFPWLNSGEWSLDVDPYVGAGDTGKMVFLRGKVTVSSGSLYLATDVSIERVGDGEVRIGNGIGTHALEFYHPGSGAHGRLASQTITGGWELLIDPWDAASAAAKRVRVAGIFEYENRIRRSGVVVPAQITSNQNDYAPSGYTGASVYRLFSDAARSISGLAAGAAGDQILLMNTGSFTITLLHNNASSAIANRIMTPAGAGYALVSNGAVELYYDGNSNRWRVISN